MAKSDIEIAREATTIPITEVAQNLGIAPESFKPFGHDKAKLTSEYINTLKDKPDGKLILVTAISPTPAGEGKTTTSVGLHDGLCRIGKK
jgi:formate--tetrahydrofolate ligase